MGGDGRGLFLLEPALRLEPLQLAQGLCMVLFGRAVLYQRVSDFEIGLKSDQR